MHYNVSTYSFPFLYVILPSLNPVVKTFLKISHIHTTSFIVEYDPFFFFWLAVLIRGSKVVVLPLSMWLSSRFPGFLPLSKAMLDGLTSLDRPKV